VLVFVTAFSAVSYTLVR